MHSRSLRVSRSIPCTATLRTWRRRAAALAAKPPSTNGLAGRPARALALRRRPQLLALDTAVRAAEEIADTGDRLDHVALRPVRRELSAQAADVQLNEVAAHVRVVAPHALEDLFLGQDASGVRHEVPQEPELGR